MKDSGMFDTPSRSNDMKKAGKVNAGSGGSDPWKYGRPSDAGHTRKSSGEGAVKNPSNARPSSIFGGNPPGKGTIKQQETSHK